MFLTSKLCNLWYLPGTFHLNVCCFNMDQIVLGVCCAVLAFSTSFFCLSCCHYWCFGGFNCTCVIVCFIWMPFVILSSDMLILTLTLVNLHFLYLQVCLFLRLLFVSSSLPFVRLCFIHLQICPLLHFLYSWHHMKLFTWKGDNTTSSF